MRIWTLEQCDDWVAAFVVVTPLGMMREDPELREELRLGSFLLADQLDGMWKGYHTLVQHRGFLVHSSC
jgi:hypothetical protein